jgi:[ribosomal protein S18]-alanine N-acetyltransferase
MPNQADLKGIIRPALPEDLPQILAIESLCFDKQWHEANFIPALKDIFFVYEQEQILGFIIACSCEIARRGVIMRVAVHPQAQSLGIASLMMAKALAALQEKKVACVELDVEITKTNVKRLYEKFGFKTLKVVNPDVDYEDEAFYVMKLRFTRNNQD